MTLYDFGWKPFFANQLELSELDTCQPARVTEVQRDAIIATTGETSHRLRLGGRWFQLDAIERPTVGDWLLIDDAGERIIRLLERSSELSRLAAGGQEQQLIAANVDTLFIITSCNDEFNASRLERYLALASNSGATAVVVLTKTDLADDPEAFVEQARRVSGYTEVVAVNALDAQSLTGLAPWCTPRSTIALLGSSGVGKSTLLNTLAGSERQATGDIREADAHGKHTTTHRSLHRLDSGLLLLDVPGLREVGMVGQAEGISSLFQDIDSLSERCRFSNCEHASEPGCAVRAAIDSGELDERRLRNFEKLKREETFNSATIAQKRQHYRDFAKKVRTAAHVKAQLLGGDSKRQPKP
ncbi:MAG: ribosome small subunit-dependent GTPase A [Pseudomonadaceae bacterium]|nr:ribosome small subunit-dependent GTPase A [Pseudomonadaceae bacterium]